MCDSQFKMLEFVSSWSNWAWEIQLVLAVRMQDAGVSGAGTECNKSFAKQRYAKAHCSKKLPWKCETCFEIIKHSQNIPRHLRRCAEATKPKPKSSLRVFTCEECPKKFSFKCNLERHMTTCHDFSKIASYPCFAYNCSFKTNSIAQLKRHNTNKHMVKDKIPCQMCTLSFMSYSGLEKHMLRIHRIECNYCTETFSSEKLLRLHRYRSHGCST